jgi:hypothetical protein
MRNRPTAVTPEWSIDSGLTESRFALLGYLWSHAQPSLISPILSGLEGFTSLKGQKGCSNCWSFTSSKGVQGDVKYGTRSQIGNEKVL